MADRCRHHNRGFFTREGGDHTGIDLFVKCKDCGAEGPYVECEQSSARVRKMALDAFKAGYPR